MSYAIISENGVEIVNDWEKAKHEMVYLKGFRYTKKFPSHKAANEFALAHLRSIAPGRKIPTDLPNNLFVSTDMLDPLVQPFTINGL